MVSGRELVEPGVGSGTKLGVKGVKNLNFVGRVSIERTPKLKESPRRKA